MWGQEQTLMSIRLTLGIIPMRVGTSRLIDLEKIADEDHPHACGDKKAYHSGIFRRRGSSPCVWGQGRIFSGELRVARIIPMRVGTRLCIRRTALIAWDHPHACGDKVKHW